MSDQEPTAREQADAEALAQALERGSPHKSGHPASRRAAADSPEAPADALEAAGLLRYSRPSAVLTSERREVVLERVLQGAAGPKDVDANIAKSPRRAVVRLFSWSAVAAAAAVAIVMLRPDDPGESAPSSVADSTKQKARGAAQSALSMKPSRAGRDAPGEALLDPVSTRPGEVPAASQKPDVARAAAPAAEAVSPVAQAVARLDRPSEVNQVARVESASQSRTLAALPTPEPAASTGINTKTEAEAAKPGLAVKRLARVLDGVDSAPAEKPGGGSVPLQRGRTSPSSASVPPQASSDPAAPQEPLRTAPAHWPLPAPQLLAAQSWLTAGGQWQHRGLDHELAAYRDGVLNAISAHNAKRPEQPATPQESR